MKDLVSKLFKNEEGYGIVELLLIVAGLGLLSITVFKNLNKGIAGDGSESTVQQVTTGINNLIEGWVD